MPSEQGLTALVGGMVIDGLGGDPIANGTLVIDRGRIVALGKASAVPVPRGTQVLDVAGRSVLPGIIDCHVHSTYRARDMRAHLLNAPTYNVLRSTHILEETLACGVTTARDMGGADAGFREAINEGYVRGPRLLISIVMISQTGGHGDSWVPAGIRLQKRAWLPSSVADGPDEMRKLVRSLLMAGADFIKICTSGGITSVTDSWDEPQFWFLDEECVDDMIRRRIWWVPTLALVPQSIGRRKIDKAWSSQQLGQEDDKEAAIYRAMQKQLPLWQDAVRRGIRVAMGTDQSHRLLVGENLIELDFMVKSLGMSPMQAIVASTSGGAECIERPELGALAPGRIADVLVVDGDPLEDIRVLGERSRIHLVMKDGRPYYNRLHPVP